MSEAKPILQKKQKGPVDFLWSVILTVFWGMVIGLVINCFMWHKEGYQNLIKDVDAAYQQQMNGIELRGLSGAHRYESLANYSNMTVVKSESLIKTIFYKLPYAKAMIESQLTTTLVNHTSQSIDHFILVFVGTFKILMAKFFSLIVSFWVFILASLLGAMDGLLSRYIRTAEGGRESTFIFHRVSGVVIKLPIVILFLYLTSPVFLNPEIVIALMSVLFFKFFYITTANLKKFL